VRSRVLVTALLAVLGLLAGTALSATQKKFYWSEARAEAVTLRIHIPSCFVIKEDPKCANGPYRPDRRPVSGFYTNMDSDCHGSDESPKGFTYARFLCTFLTIYGYSTGRLFLKPMGRLKYSWRLVAIASNRPCPCPTQLFDVRFASRHRGSARTGLERMPFDSEIARGGVRGRV